MAGSTNFSTSSARRSRRTIRRRRRSSDAAVLAVGNVPTELVDLYRRMDGANVGRVEIHDLDLFEEANGRRSADRRWAVEFAGDGGSGAFFVDSEDRLGGGRGAVYWKELADDTPAESRFIARDVPGLLRWAATASGHPGDLPAVRGRRIAAMTDAFASHRSAWIGQPGASWVALRDDEDHVGWPLPEDLKRLYMVTDGARIPSVGVTILPRAELHPLAGEDTGQGPPAVVFALGPPDVRYAVTIQGWREPDGGHVIRLDPGADPAVAPLLGPLPDLVVGWLAGKAR